jgi:hypothetical protein
MNAFSEFVQALLGLGVEPKELTSLQVSMRGIIVFVATLAMVRISSKRSLAEKTAFDVALIIIIASVLARAINGSAPFVPTLVAGFVLVLLHRLFALGAYASHAFGILVKGNQLSLSRTGALIAKTCASITSLNTTSRRTCGSMQKSKICPRSKSRGWNAAATSVLSKQNSL